jgi:hypothetical protein
MIDPQLLRQLGWDEDLIAEVNRVAQSITVPADSLPELPGPELFAAPTQSGTAFYFQDSPSGDNDRRS